MEKIKYYIEKYQIKILITIISIILVALLLIILNINNNKKDINKADLCASFEKTITEELIENTLRAAKQLNINKIALAGGVSANSYIRDQFNNLEKQGYQIFYPEPILCTDNAAMIASAGYYQYLAGARSDLSLNAVPNLSMM